MFNNFPDKIGLAPNSVTFQDGWWKELYIWGQRHFNMWVEILGVITGFICVWLAARNNIWNFPVTIISVFLYMVVFYRAQLYADMGLQVYFLAMAIYGWYYWIDRSGRGEDIKPVKRINTSILVPGLVVVALFTWLFGGFLDRNTDAFRPYLDSLCAGGSLFGSFLLSRRILENWVVWIVVDIIYLFLYISKDLYLTTLLYATYIIVAIIGYREWKKNWKAHLSK